jgi:hypothetical protein
LARAARISAYVTNMDADAEPHPLRPLVVGVCPANGPVNCEDALHGIDCAGEVGDDAVSGSVEIRPRCAAISPSMTTRQI